jgi:hypothetical protein
MDSCISGGKNSIFLKIVFYNFYNKRYYSILREKKRQVFLFIYLVTFFYLLQLHFSE